MRTISWMALGGLVLGGCAGAAPRTELVSNDGYVCPAGIAGLRASVSDLDGGGSLVMTASPHEVRELQQRIHRFEQLSEARDSKPGSDAPWLARSSLRVVDLPNGVQLDARALNEGRARELRAELREAAADVEAGVCPAALRVEG
jgi:hypothetical protein